MKLRILMLLSCTALCLSACSNSMMSRTDRAVMGGAAGGVAGAIVTKDVGGAAAGAVIGAGVGAATY